MTATLKELIDADLLAPGYIVFKYKEDCHTGTLLDDGKIHSSALHDGPRSKGPISI